MIPSKDRNDGRSASSWNQVNEDNGSNKNKEARGRSRQKIWMNNQQLKNAASASCE